METASGDNNAKVLELGPAIRKRNSWRMGLVLVVVVLLLCAGLYWYFGGRVQPREAILGGRIEQIVAPFTGRVALLAVQPGALVKPGEEVLHMDDGPLKAAVADARARLAILLKGPESPAALRAAEASLQAAIQEARSQEAAARLELEHATTLHVQAQLALRAQDSQGRRVAGDARNKARLAEIETRDAMQQAKQAFEVASRTRVGADMAFQGFRAEMARLARTGGVDPEARDAMYTWLRDAEARLAASSLRAKVGGVVGPLAVQPGEMVREGQVLTEIAPSLAFRRVLAFLDAEQTARVRQGQSAAVGIPQRGLSLNGTVDVVEAVPETARTSPVAPVAVAWIRLDVPDALAGEGEGLPPDAPVTVSIRVW